MPFGTTPQRQHQASRNQHPERKREGQASDPLAEESLDLFRAQSVTCLLEDVVIGALEKTVVQGFMGNSFLLDLAFRPFVAVDTDANRERCVGADLDEARPEIVIIDVEVVLLHKHGLTGV